jgi:hypothetical protein
MARRTKRTLQRFYVAWFVLLAACSTTTTFSSGEQSNQPVREVVIDPEVVTVGLSSIDTGIPSELSLCDGVATDERLWEPEPGDIALRDRQSCSL